MTARSLVVIRATRWIMHSSPFNAATGVDGQLTEIVVDGVHAFVRENRELAHFYVSSAERLRMKKSSGRTLPGVDVLELCAPAHAWEAIAAEVRRRDGLDRRVRRNQRFTVRWAEDVFARASRAA